MGPQKIASFFINIVSAYSYVFKSYQLIVEMISKYTIAGFPFTFETVL